MECPTPEPIQNGVYSNGSHGLGDTITYSCSEGYELVGSPNRTCQLNSSWQGEEPRCQGNNHCLQAFEIIHTLCYHLQSTLQSFMLCYHPLLPVFIWCHVHPHRAMQSTWTSSEGGVLSCKNLLLCWKQGYLYLRPELCGRRRNDLPAQWNLDRP